jgi:hypothetical protein
MMPVGQRHAVTLCVILSCFASALCSEAQAVGVLYQDPASGWLHAFDGSSAYYHDPDGRNPDYVNGNDQNQPGGQGNEPALISVGTACEPNCENIAIWQNNGSQWEGSAPGDPLGGTPIYGQFLPPLPPPAPGGVGAFTDGATTFIRIQDVGQPQSYGWADKGNQASPGSARQEGNNRRIEFKHQMSRDAGFSGTAAVIDNGVTFALRARIATAATGPLDSVYPEDGPAPVSWPIEGVGYPIANNGRGMFILSQNGAQGPSRLAFSLLDTNTITVAGIPVARTGLVMNNRAVSATMPGSPDSNVTSAERLNVLEIENELLDEWHEFWITVKALPAPIDGNTHEVNVYADGSLEPETFQVILANQNEVGTGSYLSMGLTSGTRFGAFDLDYIAYTEGVQAPTLVPMGLAGDYNDNGTVDAADYVLWRKGGPLANETVTIGSVTPEDYNEWRAHFGATSGGPALSSAIPEPSCLLLIGLAVIGCNTNRVRRLDQLVENGCYLGLL